LKAYKICIHGQRQIEISLDVTFDEDEAFKRSRETHMDEDREEQEAPREAVMENSTPERPFPKVQNEMVESERHVDPPKEATVNMKRPPCRKMKDMQLSKDLLERARDHICFPAMWH
jgi:hypothetical protein